MSHGRKKSWVDLDFQHNLDLQYQVSIKMLPFSVCFSQAYQHFTQEVF